MTRRLILSVITLCTVIACTTDAYESGDGTYSYMRADFAESYTNSQTQFFAADTDDDRHVEFQQAMAREWATTPDSVYRTLVYYSAQPDANSKCRLFSVVPVNVLRYKPVEEVKEMHTDPLYWNSIWTSSNGKYLNLGLTIMTGYTQEGEIVLQNLGLELKGKNPREKVGNAIEIYSKIEKWYAEYLRTEEARKNIAEFDRWLPSYSWIPSIKKIDYLLWSRREEE